MYKCVGFAMFLFCTVSTLLRASCYEKLLQSGNTDSAVFSINAGMSYDRSEFKAAAAFCVQRVLEEHGCDAARLELKQLRCGTTLDEILCKQESRIGYFVIVRDYMDTYHVIFNRWD